MYYVYSRSGKLTLPKFNYNLNSFESFYELSGVLTKPLVGRYIIRIQTKDVDGIIQFVRVSENFKTLDIYIEVDADILNYVNLHVPNISKLDSKNNYEIWTDLISEFGILFQTGCAKRLFYAIPKDYDSMREALILIKSEYPNQEVLQTDIEKLFMLENITYPRQACIQYLIMARHRRKTLERVLTIFGNDLTYYSIRKHARQFLKDKISYLKTGNGNDLIKKIPVYNIVRLLSVLEYNNSKKFKDISVLLALYERGENIDDYLS